MKKHRWLKRALAALAVVMALGIALTVAVIVLGRMGL